MLNIRPISYNVNPVRSYSKSCITSESYMPVMDQTKCNMYLPGIRGDLDTETCMHTRG